MIRACGISGPPAEEDFSNVGLIISLGSYDKVLHVYKFLPLAEDSLDLCYEQKTHEGMIRACGISGPYVATCSSDETVQIKNTRKDMEQIILTDHEGSVSDCDFFLTSHFFTSGDDGKINIYRIRDWALTSTLRARKAVHSIAVHPSGKLLLSVDKANELNVWNLSNGKRIVKRSMPKPCFDVRWSDTGAYYSILRANKALIYDQTGELVSVCKYNGLCCACFISDEIIAFGTQDQKILLWNIEDNEKIREVEFHESRVKCLGCGEIEGMKFLVSADSEGVVIIWKLDGLLDVDEEVVSSLLMALETECRITSMAVKPITSADEEVRLKKKRQETKSSKEETEEETESRSEVQQRNCRTSETSEKAKAKESEEEEEENQVQRSSCRETRLIFFNRKFMHARNLE